MPMHSHSRPHPHVGHPPRRPSPHHPHGHRPPPPPPHHHHHHRPPHGPVGCGCLPLIMLASLVLLALALILH